MDALSWTRDRELRIPGLEFWSTCAPRDDASQLWRRESWVNKNK